MSIACAPLCLFEDEHLLVLNKPAGLLCVPGRGEDKQDCLSARVQKLWPDALVVHRLDMATSGLVIMARSKQVQRLLGDAFATRTVEKRYTAIVAGHIPAWPKEAWQRVELPIMSDWERRPMQKVDLHDGKPSLSLFQRHPEQTHVPENCTQIWLQPITGRTHQLRLHMSHLGHPILGDHLYAPPAVAHASSRLMLHATQIRLHHPVHQQELVIDAAPQFETA